MGHFSYSLIWWEVIKFALPLFTAAGSAYLGFWFACRRDDRATRQVAAVKITLLLDRLSILQDQHEIEKLHQQSVSELCPDVIRSISTLSLKRKLRAQGAWNLYCEFSPSQFSHEEFSAAIKSWQVENTFMEFSKESLFTSKDAMTRILKAIQLALS